MSSVWAKEVGVLPTHLQRLPFQYRFAAYRPEDLEKHLAAQNQENSTDIRSRRDSIRHVSILDDWRVWSKASAVFLLGRPIG